MTNDANKWFWVWLSGLGLFILAASTGVLMRFGIIMGFPYGLQYTNVRHAHSHLMYFGWVTPALMGLILTWLPRVTERPLSPQHQKQFRIVLIIIFILSVAAYSAFMLYGYRPASVGDLSLPISTILASFNMLAWYGFIFVYWRATKGLERKRPLSLRLWDAGLAFMVLASLGAWGVAVTVIFNMRDPVLSAALTHLFLDTFSEGWFVLTLLGLAYAVTPQAATHPWASKSENLLIMGMPVVFLLTVPVTSLPPFVRLIASIGGLMVGIGLWGNIVILWRASSSAWRFPLVFLALKATTGLIITIPTLAIWAERSLLRVSYLHWLLLGFVSGGLIVVAEITWEKTRVPARRWFNITVVILILTLIPLTPLWPPALSGMWPRQAAAVATLGPVIVMIIMFAKGLIASRQP
ncbi:MAG: hypothetical protein IAF02_16315 [Anaerolineae bacterium]|nr:hypothetical protein [Anaerolineae bacterium]